MKNKAKKIILVLMVAIMVLHTIPKPVEVTAVDPYAAWKAAEIVGWLLTAVGGYFIGAEVGDAIYEGIKDVDLSYELSRFWEAQTQVSSFVACTSACTHVPMCREAYLQSLISAELAQIEAQKNLPVDLSPQPGPRPTTRVQTSQGAVDVPIMPVQMSAESLQELVESYSQSIAPILAQQESGHFFDFIEQRFRFFDEFFAELKPPHPLLQGYCSVTGLPISAFHHGSATTTIEQGTDEWDFVTQHAVTSFTNTRGQEVTSAIVPSSSQWGISYTAFAYLDGELLTGFSVPSGSTGLYFFITASNHLVRYYKTANGTFHGNNFTADLVHQNGLIPYYLTTPVTPEATYPPAFPAVTQPPNTIAINPADVNAINNLTALMQSILEIASHPDVAEGAIVLNFPVMPERADYPDLSDAQWNKMFYEILKEVTALSAVVASGASVAEMDLSHVITYDDVLATPVPATGTGVIDRILARVTSVINWLSRILNAILDIANFLLGLIASLMTALYDMLVDLLTYLFVPPEGFIQEGFDEMRSTFADKLPFQGFIAQIEQLANLPPENVEVAYLAGLAVDGNGETEVALGGFSDTPAMPDMNATMLFFLNTIRPHLGPIRFIVVALLFISMLHYNYKQIYFLLRRTHYTPSGTIMDRIEMK